MAEGRDKTVEELEQEITCPVCHGHFDDPRILPCSHYYCKKCVQALVDRARPNQPFPCPECCADTFLLQNDPNQLPRALLAVRMKDFHAKLVDERKPLHKMCSKHNDPLKLFCNDCNCLICRDCTVFDHKTHAYEFVSEATPQCKELLVTPLKETRKGYSDATDRAKAMIAEIETQNTDNTRAVNQWVERYVDIIRSCGRNLVEEVSSSSKRKIESLKVQIKGFESESALIQSLEQSFEQNLENATDEEFIEMHEQILSRVEVECRKHKDANLELAEEADIGVKLPSYQSLNDLCRNEAKVLVHVLNVNPASCTVNLERVAEVNKSSRLTVCTLYRNGTPCKKPQAVEGELNSLVDGSLVRIKGTPTMKGGEYEIVYTPRIRGRHQLAVTVNGEQVAGSPFTMCVKIPPTQLGTPVRVISGQGGDSIYGAYGVAFNSAGNVLIGTHRRVLVFDKTNLVQTLHVNFDVQSIAVDVEDNIFVADTMHVYKLDKGGKQLKVIGRYGSENAEFKNLSGLTVKGEQVFVCDSDNDRIQVFNRELEFVKVIKGQFKKVCDVSQDEGGNLYVCDRDNNRIQVLNSEGEFLYAFGTYGKEKGKLDRPRSVCVSDQFVYVCEYGNVRVSVFKTNGCFVTSFSIGHSFQSWFTSNLCRLTVSRDGFLCICDSGNHNVVIL